MCVWVPGRTRIVDYVSPIEPTAAAAAASQWIHDDGHDIMSKHKAVYLSGHLLIFLSVQSICVCYMCPETVDPLVFEAYPPPPSIYGHKVSELASSKSLKWGRMEWQEPDTAVGQQTKNNIIKCIIHVEQKYIYDLPDIQMHIYSRVYI